MPKLQTWERVFINMHPLQRILLALVFSAVAFALFTRHHIAPLLLSMCIWDVFSFIYLLTCAVVIVRRSTTQIRSIARQQDGSRFFVSFLIILSSFAGMATVAMLLLTQQHSITAQPLYLPVTVLGMLLSWLMVHTTFTFHYAHLYYGDDTNDSGKHAGGLDFPNDTKPDYLDFAYFSFVLGMTFQVSDVTISSKRLRRLALLHGLLSFGLNTFVVALTINLIAGGRN